MSTVSRQPVEVDRRVVMMAQHLVDGLAACLEREPNASAETQDEAIATSLEWLDLLSLERDDPQVIAVTAYLVAATPVRVSESLFSDEHDDLTGLFDAVRNALAVRRTDLAVAPSWSEQTDPSSA